MRLRNKVAIIVLIIWGLMFSIAYIGSQRILKSSYLQLEEKQAYENIHRVYQAIEQMLAAVKTMDVNWAVWDDTYKFIDDKNEAYIKSNLPASSFAAADIDIMLFFNAKGQAVYTVAVNADRTEIAPLPPKLDEYLSPTGKLVHQPEVTSNTTGFIDIPSGILLVSANAVVTSENKGPVKGTLIMARYFTDSSLVKVSEVTKLNVALFRMDKIVSNNNLNLILTHLESSKGRDWINITGKNTLMGYKLMRDINDKPIAILEIKMDRNVYNAGLQTIRYYNIAFFSIGILLTILLMYMLNTVVVKRLERLNDEIVHISESKSFDSRVSRTGNDEVASVSSKINQMLTVIQDYDQDQKKLLQQISNELAQVNKFSKKLQEAENLLRNVINSMPSILVMVDNKLNINLLNTVASDYLKMPSDQVVGKSLFQLFPFLNRYKAQFENALKFKEAQHIEKITNEDPIVNKTYYYNAIVYVFTRNEEEFLTVRLDDITTTIAIEQTLTQNEKLAALGVLTAGIAHEINNPINFLSATISPLKNNLHEIIELLNKYIKIRPEDKNFIDEFNKLSAEIKNQDIDLSINETYQLIESIKEGTNRTIAIVKDLRTFSRVDEDAMKKADINDAIQSTLNLLRHKFKEKITIKTDFGKIPEVDCYPGKINQVFMNVIANAIDAIPDKGEIYIKTFREKDNVVVSVEDTGIGIPEENINKIFEPFFTTKEVGHGTGLGLSISFGIVRDHKGTISVKSKVGKGSEFIITIPIEQKEVKG